MISCLLYFSLLSFLYLFFLLHCFFYLLSVLSVLWRIKVSYIIISIAGAVTDSSVAASVSGVPDPDLLMSRIAGFV
jgi:Tat protein secretion system quality control protein TatD with DNase activity